MGGLSRILVLVLVVALATPSVAQEADGAGPPAAAEAEGDAGAAAICEASVEGATVHLAEDGSAAAAVDGAPACAPQTILRHLTPALAEGERGVFCLVREDATVTGFAEGARDDDLSCQQAGGFCERVNASRDAALEIAGLAEDAQDLGEQAGAAVSGARSLTERAGATILTGTGGAVAGTLSNLGATALAAVTAPAAIAAGVVSVVAVGGAVYICR